MKKEPDVINLYELNDLIETKTFLEKNLTPDKLKKLELLLENLDFLEFGKDTILIGSKKNIVIFSEKNLVNAANETIVSKSKIIHLNPFVSIKKIWDKLLKNKSLKELEDEKQEI